MNGIEMAAGGSFSLIDRLLIFLSRIDPGERSFSLARDMVSLHINWDAFVRKSVQQGVAPLIYRNLRSLRGLVPGKALDDLRSVFYRNALRNERLYRTASAFFHEIQRFGLRVAVTKGARLALTLYPDRGLRAFADIDLFVHPEDWPALQKILDEKGFEANSARQNRLDPRNRSLHWTFSPYYRLGDLLIELHFAYLGLHLPFLSEDDLWASAGTAKNGDVEIPVLSPEYELCYLCLHALQHSYSRLVWLTDIAEHASRGNVDWDRAAGICRDEGITAGVRHGLDLVNALWPGTLPEDIPARFRVTPLEARLLGLLWPAERILSRGETLLFPYYTSTLFALLARKKPLLAVRTVLGILFPPKAWVAESYNIRPGSPRILLHYAGRLYRPFQLILRRWLGDK
jgi:hypothetical protein